MTLPINKLTFSLILSTLGNNIAFISRFLDSISAQKGDHTVKISIVDQSNGSSKIASLLEAYPRLDIQYLPSNTKGLSNGRNHALSHNGAQLGDIIAFPDDDCWYPPELFNIVTDQFNQLQCDILFGVFNDAPDLSTFSAAENQYITAKDVPALFAAPSITLFFKHDIARTVSQFDTNFGIGAPFGAGEETDFLLRAFYNHAVICRNPTLTVGHPIKSGALTWKRGVTYGSGYGAISAKHFSHIKSTIIRLFAKRALTDIAHIGISLLRFKPQLAQHHVGKLYGRISGFFSYRHNTSL